MKDFMPPDIMHLRMPKEVQMEEKNFLRQDFEQDFQPVQKVDAVPSVPLRFGIGYTNIWVFLTISLVIVILLYMVLVKHK